MNDRGKFRVWDTKDKEYLDPDYYEGFWMSPDGVVHVGITEWNGICDAYQEIPSEQLIVEHCTGLKDRNGKLIYEGDLVVVPNQYPFFDYADDVQHKSLNDTFGVIEHDAVPNYVGIVDWADESAQFVIVLQCVNPSKSGISDGDCHYFDDDENLEIAGNVHEMEVE